MKMGTNFNLDQLISDLRPVRRLKSWHAMVLTLVATLIAASLVIGVYGLRADLARGEVHPMVLLRSGMLLLMGVATTLATISAGQPAIGRTSNGWRWTLAAAGLFPLSALLLAGLRAPVTMAELHPAIGMYCLQISIASAVLIGGALTLWLRQGAPTLLNQAGWLTGLAAGSLGTFAFSLHCPETGIYYIGLWYSAAVAVSAVIGRLIVPSFIRW
jgi:hypothetical protein